MRKHETFLMTNAYERFHESSSGPEKADRDIEGDERGSAQEKTLEVHKNEVQVLGS